MAKSRKLTAADVRDFIGRMEFLEQSWGVTTEWEVDEATGYAWVKLRRPDTPAVVLSIKRVHVHDLLLPAS